MKTMTEHGTKYSLDFVILIRAQTSQIKKYTIDVIIEEKKKLISIFY